MMKLRQIFNKLKPQDKKLTDNYDKTAHILNISYNYEALEFTGFCSLCGHSMYVYRHRCPYCRAKIEEDERQ